VGVGLYGELTGPDGLLDWYQVNSNSPALPTGVPAGQAVVPANGTITAPARLFRARADGTFDEVSGQASPAHPDGFGVDLPGGSPWGTSAADFDGDGFLDVFVSCGGFIMDSPNALLRAAGDGTFTNVSEQAGLVERQLSRTGVWLDVDRDGDLDLHVTNGHPAETSFFIGRPDLFTTDRLYVNQGDGTFVEGASAAGVALPSTSFAATTADLDQDGLADLVVACFKQFNKVFYARGDGTFSFMLPATSSSALGFSDLLPDPQFPGTLDFPDSDAMAGLMDRLPVFGEASLPVEAADFNGDGWLDLIFGSWSNQLEDANLLGAEGGFFGPFERTYLYLNRGDQDGDGYGDGLFREVAQEVAIDLVGGVMGLRVEDFNGDGFPDVYLAAGGPKPDVHLEEDYTFINEPTAWPSDFQQDPDQPLGQAFYEVGAWTGTYANVFMAHGVNSRVGHLGNLDLIISNGGPGQIDQGQPNAYLRNQGNVAGPAPKRFELELSDPGAPLPHGAGARVNLFRDFGGGAGQQLVRQLDTNHGFSSQALDPVPFYTGGEDLLFTSVRWPDGWQQGLLLWPIATQLHGLSLERSPVSMTFDRVPQDDGSERLSTRIEASTAATLGTLWLARISGIDPQTPTQSPFTVTSLAPVAIPLILQPGESYSASLVVPQVQPGLHVLRYVGLSGETLAEAALWRPLDGPLPATYADLGEAPSAPPARRSVLARDDVRLRVSAARLVRNVARPTAAQERTLELERPGQLELGSDVRLAWQPDADGAGTLRVRLGERPGQWQFEPAQGGQVGRLYLDVPLACCDRSLVDPRTGESPVPDEPGWRLEVELAPAAVPDPEATSPAVLIDGWHYGLDGSRRKAALD
jgi:hypothetical protein